MDIASVGPYSGVAGGSTVPVLKGLQVWVAHINAKGGVNGHLVRLAVYDDGTDPARHRAQVQDAIERRGVVAFVANVDALSGQSSLEYIEKKRVPVVGISGSEPWAYESPMVFPQGSSGDFWFRTWPPATAKVVIPQGKRKVGTVVCSEAPACSAPEHVWAEMAQAVGLQYVHRGKTSLAQPDYTAECLAARNAGAEILNLVLTTNAVNNLVSSCTRQGFKPTYVLFGNALAPVMDNELYDGTIAPFTVFPWFLKGTPATDEFHEAMRNFNRGEVPYATPYGWSAAKMFEKAAANLPEPPNSAAVLAGLWTFRDETLGGLVSPRSFVENQPTKPTVCWFDVLNAKGRWISPDGAQQHCL